MNTTRISNGQPFSRLGNLLALCLVVALMVVAVPSAHASDPNGLYAFVDRVVFEPSEAAPERIQVWGGFAIAKGRNGYEYHDAERGYLYFKLRPGDEAICKKEWADLKSVAGKKEIVSFGSRYEQGELKVRKSDAKAENPDLHPKSWGMTKTGMRDYPPIRQLEKLMSQGAPATKASPGSGAAPKTGGN
jgi:hypothetical protein